MHQNALLATRIVLSLFVLIVASPLTSRAQIEVASSGNTLVGSGSVSSSAKLKVNENSLRYALYVYNTGSGVDDSYATYSKVSTDEDYGYGIYAASTGAATKNYAGYFSGDVHYTGSLTSTSDERLKKNVRAIDANIKSALLSIQPIRYQFASSSELSASGIPTIDLPEGEHYGFSAQELQAVAPELVHIAPLHHDDSPESNAFESLSINYQEVIPILLAIIQDQRQEIDSIVQALSNAGIVIE